MAPISTTERQRISGELDRITQEALRIQSQIPNATESPSPTPSADTTNQEFTPRYPTTKPTTGAVARPKTELDRAQESLFGTAQERAGLTDEDKDAVRQRIRGQFDEQIAAINAYSNTLSQQATQRGVGRLGQDRAIQNVRGTTGGSFGAQQTEGVRGVNAQEQQVIEQERQLLLAELYTKIDQRALNELQAKKEEASGKASAYVDYLKASATEARNDIKALAAGGVPLEQIPEEEFAALLKDSGYTPSVFKAIYASNAKSGAGIEGFSTKIDGNQIVTSWFNKATGKAEFDIRPLSEGDSNNFQHSQFNSETGDIVLWSDAGESKVIKATAGKPKSQPASYQEWVLAGQPGDYASWLKKKEGSTFKPTADERSAANRYIQQLPGYTPADSEKLESDPAFFYAILQKAIEGSEGGTGFPIQPFKYPYFGPSN